MTPSMATFGNQQPRRQVKRGDVDSRTNNGYSTSAQAGNPEGKQSRKLWKKLLVTLLILAAIVGIGLGALWFYIKATPLKGEGAGRINIMVLGVDDAASLSDTIMIASIDTSGDDPTLVALISIPRDLYVQIPEFGGSKINAAYTYGQSSDYPEGGPGLSRATLEGTFDLPIHYYAALDFTGFRELIDTVGGVDIDVKTEIEDPFYPNDDYSDTQTFYLPTGRQHMDGETALRYARSRITTTDFDRAARQQQILGAFRQRVVSRNILLSGQKRRALQQTLEQHLKTDLSIRQMLKLGWLLRNLEDAQISRHVIDNTNFLESDGGGAYVPRTGDFDQINQFIADIFEQTGNNLPETQQ